MKKANAWSVGVDQTLVRLPSGFIDLEAHLEEWIKSDPALVSEKVMVIAQQVVTKYGKRLDLLGIDELGDLAVVEIKRDETLRDTVAQGIEYAAWASELGADEILDIARSMFGSEEAFRGAFAERFGDELPETLNQMQSIYIVAPTIADFTASGINYLSSKFGVPINGVSFDVFDFNGQWVLVKHEVVEEEPAAPATSKRQTYRSLEEFRQLADDNGVAEIFDVVLSARPQFDEVYKYLHNVLLRKRSEDGRMTGVLSVYPAAVENAVVVHFRPPEELAAIYGVSAETARRFAQEVDAFGHREASIYKDWPRYSFRTTAEAAKFVNVLTELASNRPPEPVP
jgi:hypothetical protein